MNSIPLLGIPVLNRGDLLLRCLHSIDYPVDHLYLINNGNDESVGGALLQISATDHPIRRYCKYISVGKFNVDLGALPRWWGVERPVEQRQLTANLGVSGSWNEILERLRVMELDYAMISGNDICFAPGDLAKLGRFAATHPDHAVCFGNHGYSLFTISSLAYAAGLAFDLNIYPAYLEDCDHFYRIKLTGAKSANVPDVRAIHGEAPHWGSSTIYSDPVFHRRNDATHAGNFAYYQAKWGGINGDEKFTHPFNEPGNGPNFWRFDPERRKQQLWPVGANGGEPS